MQSIDSQTLNEVPDSLDEVVGLVSIDDGLNDALHVLVLVGHTRRLVQQLLDDVGELLRQRLAHL